MAELRPLQFVIVVVVFLVAIAAFRTPSYTWLLVALFCLLAVCVVFYMVAYWVYARKRADRRRP